MTRHESFPQSEKGNLPTVIRVSQLPLHHPNHTSRVSHRSDRVDYDLCSTSASGARRASRSVLSISISQWLLKLLKLESHLVPERCLNLHIHLLSPPLWLGFCSKHRYSCSVRASGGTFIFSFWYASSIMRTGVSSRASAQLRVWRLSANVEIKGLGNLSQLSMREEGNAVVVLIYRRSLTVGGDESIDMIESGLRVVIVDTVKS